MKRERRYSAFTCNKCDTDFLHQSSFHSALHRNAFSKKVLLHRELIHISPKKMKCNARAAGRQWEWISHTEFILLFCPAYKSKCHFLIAAYLLRWGGNSCVNTAVAMETAGFPYLFFPLTQIVHVVLALKSSESSQAPLLCFSLSLSSNPADWCVIWMICVSQAPSWHTAARSSAALQQDVWLVPLASVPVWLFSACLREEHEFSLLLMVKVFVGLFLPLCVKMLRLRFSKIN